MEGNHCEMSCLARFKNNIVEDVKDDGSARFTGWIVEWWADGGVAMAICRVWGNKQRMMTTTSDDKDQKQQQQKNRFDGIIIMEMMNFLLNFRFNVVSSSQAHTIIYDMMIWLNERSLFCSPRSWKSFWKEGKWNRQQLRRTFSKYANDIIFHLQWMALSSCLFITKPLASTRMPACSSLPSKLWWRMGWKGKPKKGIEHTEREQSTHHHNKHNINIHTFTYITHY